MKQKDKIILIFSTQRSGSTMVTSDFTQTNILGRPSEYFTEKILPQSKFKNCLLNTTEIEEEINAILQKAYTANGIVSIKVMSDYIVEIAKGIEKIENTKSESEDLNKFQEQERKVYLQKAFVNFFNGLDIDNKFIAFRVYRKDKVKQALSRFVAAKTGLYHVWQNGKGKLVNHYDRPSDKATPFSLDMEKSYNYEEISGIIDSIYEEERELDIFFENFDISPINLVYEDIVKDTEYLKSIVANIRHTKNSKVENVPRKTVKTASSINGELGKRFLQDGGYRSKFERIFSSSKNVLRHISSFPNGVMVNESCFLNKQIVDIDINPPSFFNDDNNVLVVTGVIISLQDINKIFVVDPIHGEQYQAKINLKSEYYGSIYWKLSNSNQSRFRCLIPLKKFTLHNRENYSLELNYIAEKSIQVKFALIDISSFIKQIVNS